jgi:hypothetical protein
MAYNTYDPIGNERHDYLMARLAYAVTRALHPKAELKFQDFMPKYGPEGKVEEEPNDPELVKSKVSSMFMRLGGIVKRKK